MENYAISSANQSLNLSPFLGYRFNPKDEELVEHLGNKRDNPNYDGFPFITDFDVYQEEPRRLPWDPSLNYLFTKDERYFFVQRKPYSGKDTGKRPIRTVYSGKGWWNASGKDKPIRNQQNQVIGFMRSLTYFVLKEDDKENGETSSSKKSRKERGEKTDWIMHEYVCDKNNVQGWALCRIYYNNKTAPLIFPGTSTSGESTLTCSSNNRVAESEVEEPNPKRVKTTGVESCDDHVAAAAEGEKDDFLDGLLSNWDQFEELHNQMLADGLFT